MVVAYSGGVVVGQQWHGVGAMVRSGDGDLVARRSAVDAWWWYGGARWQCGGRMAARWWGLQHNGGTRLHGGVVGARGGTVAVGLGALEWKNEFSYPFYSGINLWI